MRRWGQELAVNALAWGVGLIWIVPFIGILMSALRPQSELIHGWWQFSSFTISLDNFLKAWNHPTAPIGQGIRNSLAVVIPATVLPIFIGAMAAYALLRFPFPLRDPLFLTIVLLMAIPQQMVAVPLFRFLRDLGLINSYLGLILVHTAWALPWVILFLRNYFSTFPLCRRRSRRRPAWMGRAGFRSSPGLCCLSACPAWPQPLPCN